MNRFRGKRIGIGVPKFYQFDKMIEKELSALGFDVANFSYFEPNLSDEEVVERKDVYLENQLRDSPILDFALIIRPDLYDLRFLSKLKKKVKYLVGYQWDGLTVFPEIYKYIPLFDKFFSFDPQDSENGNVYPLMNFYPEAVKEIDDKEYVESDLFYIGKNYGNRSLVLKSIIDVFDELNMSALYYLRGGSEKYSRASNFNVDVDAFTYKENLQFVFKTKVVLDIQKEVHKGLSFRVFESIGFDKKLITTNSSVKRYEFYNQNNILVWQDQSLDEIREFLARPYRPVKTKERYGFRNWIMYVLGEDDYIPTEIY